MTTDTVLLIEDNDQNRYLITFLLQHHGFRVETASDGRSGLERARELIPGMILLDIQLPHMHGYDVAQALRADPSTAAIPIVAVTSHAMVGDRDRAIASGCDGYIEKPIDPETFVGQISAFLSRSTS